MAWGLLARLVPQPGCTVPAVTDALGEGKQEGTLPREEAQSEGLAQLVGPVQQLLLKHLSWLITLAPFLRSQS